MSSEEESMAAKQILVVDDEKEIREIVAFVLTRDGFRVETAASGQHLQRLLERHVPDLIILDVMMPGVDGYDIFRTLRNDPATSHIPIIIITGHAEDIYERISVDLGAAYHLKKPFHPFTLAEVVKALLLAQ